VCQLPMLFVGMLKYLQPGMFLWIIYYNVL
jgi:hypothetical protein